MTTVMGSAGVAARVTGLEELASWVAAASARGCIRFELWVKVRGAEQERVHTSAVSEPFDIADELLTRVERDKRVELGQAVYAVFAYRSKDKTPAERAFISLVARAVAMPMMADVAANATHPSAAAATVLAAMHDMTRDVFGSLQRENEHQRRTNESLVKSSSGYFETFAKGYERTLSDLQSRLEISLREAAELRAKNDQLQEQTKTISLAYEELSKSRAAEEAAAKRKEKRMDELFDQAKVLAPLVIAKAGNKPGSAAFVTEGVIGALLGSLTNEQTNGISALLNEAQRGVLSNVLLAHRKAQAKTDAASAKGNGVAHGVKTSGQSVPASSATPANDATIDEATEHDFVCALEVLRKHGPQFEQWMDRNIGELAAKEKNDAEAAVPKGDTSNAKNEPDGDGA